MDQMPYMAMVAGKPKLNTARISESIITALVSSAVTAMFIMYIAVERLDERVNLNVEYLKSDISSVKDDIKELKEDTNRNYNYIVGRLDKINAPHRLTK
jgi:hypothetical protein